MSAKKEEEGGIIIHNSFIQWFPQVSHSGSVVIVPGKYFATKMRIGGVKTLQRNNIENNFQLISIINNFNLSQKKSRKESNCQKLLMLL